MASRLRLVHLALLVAGARSPKQSESFVLKGAGVLAQEEGLKAAAEGRYTEAIPLLQKASTSAPRSSPVEQHSLARVRNALGGAHKALGHFGEAGSFFESACTLLEQATPMKRGGAVDEDDEDDEDDTVLALRAEAALVLSNLGTIRAELGRPQEAEALYQRALSQHASWCQDGRPMNDALRCPSDYRRAAYV